MKLYFANYTDRADAVITASSSITTLPASNVADPRPSRLWRSLSTSATDTLTVTWSAPLEVSGVVLFKHTLQDTDVITLTLKTGGTTLLTVPIVWRPDAIFSEFAPCQAQSATITIVKATTASRDIGRVYLGPVFETVAKENFSGVSLVPVDKTVITRAISYTPYCDIRSKVNTLKVPFDVVFDDEAKTLVSTCQSLGIHTPLFVSIQDDLPQAGCNATPWDNCYYTLLTKLVGREVTGVDGELYHKMIFEFEEYPV